MLTSIRTLHGALALILLGSVCSWAVVNEYVLRPGDVISINVVEHEEFSQKAKIRPDGRINYPLVGEIEVAGLTSAQLVKVMEEKLAPYVNNVVVSISIDAYFSNKIFIIGAVNRSGEYQIFEPIDVMKALALAGGILNPKLKTVRVVRASGEVTSLKMEDFWQKKGGREKEKYLLYPGDTLYVPESFRVPWTIMATIFSMLNIMVNIWVLLGRSN